MRKSLRQFGERGASPRAFSCKRYTYCLVRRTCTRTQRHTGFVPVQSHQLVRWPLRCATAWPPTWLVKFIWCEHEQDKKRSECAVLCTTEKCYDSDVYMYQYIMYTVYIMIMDVWEREPNWNACKQVNPPYRTGSKAWGETAPRWKSDKSSERLDRCETGHRLG